MSTFADRVQAHTAERVNQQIQAGARQRVLAASGESEAQITARIRQLEQEWDIERWLEMNASLLALSGTVLGLVWNRKFFAIPCLVLPFLLQHAIHGWCPPIPILRRRGVRTQREIDEEKFALKALRGDFDPLKEKTAAPVTEAQTAWNATAR